MEYQEMNVFIESLLGNDTTALRDLAFNPWLTNANIWNMLS